MPTTYIYVFKWFKVSKKTRKTSEVCKKPVLQNKNGGCSWSKVTQISKLKLVFLKNSWAICNQNSYESLRENINENFYK